MTLVALPCGIHEARRTFDPCPWCAVAAKQTDAEVSASIEDMARSRAMKRRAAAERIERGKEDTMAGHSRYTDEQKADALRRVAAGEQAKDVAKELKCSPGLIHLWKKQADEALNRAVAGTTKTTKAARPAKAVRVEKATKKHPNKGARVPIALVVDESKAKTWPDIMRNLLGSDRPTALDDTLAVIDKLKGLLADPALPTKERKRVVDNLGKMLALRARLEEKSHTVAEPAAFAHEDVIAFLAKLPPMPWALGDAIRLLAFHAIDGDFDDVQQARERIDAHLRAKGGDT